MSDPGRSALGLTSHAADDRHVQDLAVATYVPLDRDTTVAALAALDDETLTTLLREATGTARISVEASSRSAPSLVVGGGARMVVAWTATVDDGDPVAGTATIVILPVQTGADVLTEVLVEVEPASVDRERAALVTRRFADLLASRLAA